MVVGSVDHLSYRSNLNKFALNLTDLKYKFKKKITMKFP